MDTDIAQLRRAAVDRMQARRWEPVDARKALATALLEGRDPPRVFNDWHAPQFNPAKTLGEFLDDRLLERTWPGDPGSQVAVAIIEAMREGRDAAASTVKQARGLTPLQQYLVYSLLVSWRRGNFAPAEAVLAAVLSAWAKLRLAEQRPDDD